MGTRERCSTFYNPLKGVSRFFKVFDGKFFKGPVSGLLKAFKVFMAVKVL